MRPPASANSRNRYIAGSRCACASRRSVLDGDTDERLRRHRAPDAGLGHGSKPFSRSPGSRTSTYEAALRSPGRGLYLLHLLDDAGVGGISTGRPTRESAGTDLLQELQSLGGQLGRHEAEPRDVPARSGEARDEARPQSGSPTAAMTMGMVFVASLAAPVAGSCRQDDVDASGGRGRRRGRAIDRTSRPHRYSMTTFRPSMYPSSRSAVAERVTRACACGSDPMYGREPEPTDTFPGCCASAASGAARRARAQQTIDTTRVIARLHPAPPPPSPARSVMSISRYIVAAVVRCSSAFARSPVRR